MSSETELYKKFIEDEDKTFRSCLMKTLLCIFPEYNNNKDLLNEMIDWYLSGKEKPKLRYRVTSTYSADNQAASKSKKIPVDDSIQKIEIYKRICELLNKRGLNHRSFLLLGVMKEGRDEEYIKSEFEAFIKIYPGETAKNKNPHIIKIVSSYSKACEEIDAFTNSLGKNAILPQVFLNAHGGSSGTIAFQKGEFILNDRIIHDIQESIRKQMIPNQSWPMALRIVLGQCFSHKFTIDTYPWVQVIPMTSSQEPQAHREAEYEENEGDPDMLLSSVHKELEAFGITSRDNITNKDLAVGLADEVCGALNINVEPPNSTDEVSIENV